jgi:hypothetical protein
MTLVQYSETNLPDIKEIRDRWCFGLPLYDQYANPMADLDIQDFIDGAITTVERHLGIYLKPMKIVTNAAERGLVEGTDYDISEPAYDYSAKEYRNWGFLQLRERPVQSLDSVKLVLPNGQIIVDFLTRPEWVKLYAKQGQIQIVPYAGDPTIFYLLGGSQSGYPFVTGQINQNMPQMWYIDYTAGYPVNKVPKDIRNIVGKMAAVDVLGIAGEALKAGVTNMSTSIDGLSESVGTTVSANSTLYSAHINQYKKEIDYFFDETKSGARSSERGLTFTVI